MTSLIRATNVSKSFSNKEVVKDISFEVNRGEVVALLGPNGAGKSTTLRMLAGYLDADRGAVSILNVPMSRRSIRAKRFIGYLPESAPAYRENTVSEFLRFIARVRGMSGAEAERAVSRVIEMCFLHSVRRQLIETLSKGYQHRICLAQSLLSDPPVILFDEPTDGLDPNQKHELREMIRNMASEKAIILSTHILEEVEAFGNRVLVMSEGKIVADASPSSLRESSVKARRIHMVLGGLGKVDQDHWKSVFQFQVIRLEPTASGLSVDAQVKHLSEVGKALDALARCAIDSGARIVSLDCERGDMNEVFRRLTGHADHAHEPKRQDSRG